MYGCQWVLFPLVSGRPLRPVVAGAGVCPARVGCLNLAQALRMVPF